MPGGVDALYRLNEETVGPDPDRLAVGVLLALPPGSGSGRAGADGLYGRKVPDIRRQYRILYGTR
ncbi:hypothetical protein OIM90_26265 [Streptomyces sp. AD16]|nr:hypothetical protein OIM90_26265 [Streptomyces sp. AD16]